MKIALAQINTTVGDFAGNVDRIVKYARCAQERGADLVVFPELALCGYPPRDLVEKPGFIRKSESRTGAPGRRCSRPFRRWWATCVAPTLCKAKRWRMPRLGSRTARWCWITPRSCSPFTMFLTSRVISNPANPSALHEFNGFKRRHHHLRRHLERQAFLEETTLHPRSCRGVRSRRGQSAAEYRLLSLQHGENPIAPRHAEGHRGYAPHSRGLRQSRGGKRPTGFRRLQHGLQRPGRALRPRPLLRGRPGDFRYLATARRKSTPRLLPKPKRCIRRSGWVCTTTW